MLRIVCPQGILGNATCNPEGTTASHAFRIIAVKPVLCFRSHLTFSGAIIGAVKKGKKVIAVPRKHEYGEHVNNHQIQIIKDFTDKGYIIGIKNVEDLHDAIIKSKTFEPVKYQPNNSKMLKIIENFIENI